MAFQIVVDTTIRFVHLNRSILRHTRAGLRRQFMSRDTRHIVRGDLQVAIGRHFRQHRHRTALDRQLHTQIAQELRFIRRRHVGGIESDLAAANVFDRATQNVDGTGAARFVFITFRINQHSVGHFRAGVQQEFDVQIRIRRSIHIARTGSCKQVDNLIFAFFHSIIAIVIFGDGVFAVARTQRNGRIFLHRQRGGIEIGVVGHIQLHFGFHTVNQNIQPQRTQHIRNIDFFSGTLRSCQRFVLRHDLVFQLFQIDPRNTFAADVRAEQIPVLKFAGAVFALDVFDFIAVGGLQNHIRHKRLLLFRFVRGRHRHAVAVDFFEVIAARIGASRRGRERYNIDIQILELTHIHRRFVIRRIHGRVHPRSQVLRELVVIGFVIAHDQLVLVAAYSGTTQLIGRCARSRARKAARLNAGVCRTGHRRKNGDHQTDQQSRAGQQTNQLFHLRRSFS